MRNPKPVASGPGYNIAHWVHLSSCHTNKLGRLLVRLAKVGDVTEDKEMKATRAVSAPRTKFVSGSEADKIIRLYATGLSAVEVWSRVNRAARTVTDVLRRHGIEIRQHTRALKVDVTELARLYESRMSLVKVAKVTGISRTTAGKYLHESGLRLRSKSEAAGNAVGAKY